MHPPLPSPRILRRPVAAPRGAATLVVVMVLFFIVALVAAYTSRNLIFEQRTSANQYRATQAFEAAESGLEWALTLLNSGRIDSSCMSHNDPSTSDDSFRMRYLAIAPDTGRITARLRAGAGGAPRQAACVFNGNDWQCHCPEDAALSLGAPSGTGPFPAFVLRFHDVAPDATSYPAGVVRIESVGCTRLDSASSVCASTTASGDGRATVNAVVALKSALATTPSAAVTVRGDLSNANGLSVTNTDVASGSLTLRVGGTISGTPQALNGPAGTPSDLSNLSRNTTVASGDTSLSDLATAFPLNTPDRMFSLVFAAERDTYRLQPAAVHVDCAPKPSCMATTVRDQASLNPGRVLWVNGDLDLNVSGPIGSATLPVVLVVNGKLSISDPSAQVNGLVYVVDQTLTASGGLINGALVAEDDLALAGSGTISIVYDADVLNLLHRGSGSFVRVPGGWRDF